MTLKSLKPQLISSHSRWVHLLLLASKLADLRDFSPAYPNHYVVLDDLFVHLIFLFPWLSLPHDFLFPVFCVSFPCVGSCSVFVRLRADMYVFAAVLSAWWGLWAEALVVQKSGSSSVLAEGKPESCGKTLLLEWLVRQLHLYMLQISWCEIATRCLFWARWQRRRFHFIARSSV